MEEALLSYLAAHWLAAVVTLLCLGYAASGMISIVQRSRQPLRDSARPYRLPDSMTSRQDSRRP